MLEQELPEYIYLGRRQVCNCSLLGWHRLQYVFFFVVVAIEKSRVVSLSRQLPHLLWN